MKGPSPKTSPEKLETTFPAEGAEGGTAPLLCLPTNLSFFVLLPCPKESDDRHVLIFSLDLSFEILVTLWLSWCTMD